MTHVRPHAIFDLVPEAVSQRIAQVKIPYRTECWLLETFLLIAAMRIVNAKRIFEFGTFRGASTLNMAMNAPDGDIFTFDIAETEAPSPEQNEYDSEIMRQHRRARVMQFEEAQHCARIHRLEGNSLTFDCSPYHRSMDLVFVDGGHDYRTLSADSASAFRMVPVHAGCVVWHDYGNPEYPEVQRYLDKINLPVFHVEESRMCFWFGDHDLIHRIGL